MNKKPLLIAHAEDPDGIISRALEMRYFCMGGNHFDNHVFVRYDRIVEAFEQAVQLAGQHESVYVSDVSLNQRLIDAGGHDFALLEKLAAGKESFWFDHHDETLSHKEKLAELGINVIYDANQCGSLLVARHFGLQSSYDRKLAKIAQAHDYKNTSDDAENIRIGNELEKVIALANENMDYGLLLDLCSGLRDRAVFDKRWKLHPHWQQYADDFDARKDAAFRELDDSVEIVDAGSRKVLFGYCSSLLSQKPGPYFLRDNHLQSAEIFVCMFKPPVRNHMILTKKDSSFPLIDLLRELGGGGRGNGGGFSLDYDVTPENYKQARETLRSQIERYV